MKKFDEKNVAENPLYHDTWKLLKNTVMWFGAWSCLFSMSGQNLRSSMALPSRIFWILSTWPAPIWRAAILSITPSALSAATKC